MPINFTRNQMDAHLGDDDDFIDYFVDVIMPTHLPAFADMAASPQTRDMVRWGRRYAEHFGFRDPATQVHFVVLMWKVGPDFFQFPPYREILADRGASADEKMERCNLSPTFEEEDHAIRNSNSAYWHPQYMRDNILGVPYDDAEEEYLRSKNGI